MPDVSPAAVLACPMGSNDADAATIGEYLTSLLHAVWRDQEDFSGKRPFGNSGWSGDIEKALIDAGMVDGCLDDWGYIDEVDDTAVDQLIRSAIDAMRPAP